MSGQGQMVQAQNPQQEDFSSARTCFIVLAKVADWGCPQIADS
jgi:hypothetical protein